MLPVRIADHLFGTPVQGSYAPTPEGGDEAETAQTIRLMRRYAEEDATSPLVYSYLHGRRDALATCRHIFEIVRNRVRYTHDEELARYDEDQPEVLVRPVDLLSMRVPSGDCDDFSMLTAALLLAAGIPCSYRTVAADPTAPDTYSHVYVIAHLPEGDLALDTSHGQYAGWEVEHSGKLRDWLVGPDRAGRSHLQGIGYVPWDEIARTAATTVSTIARERYAVPPAGVYRQNENGNSVFYRQQAGANPLSFPGIGIQPGANSQLLYLLAGGVILALLVRR